MSRLPSDSKRRVILDAACGLLVKRGFQNVALDDVARAAGVAKGTLFLYFKSKDELFSAAFADLVDRLGETLEVLRLSGKQGDALLRRAIRAILEHFDRKHDFLSQFGAGRFPGCGSHSTSLLLTRFSGNLRRLTKLLKLCARDGRGTPRELESAAVTLFSLCRSALFYRRLTGRKEPLAAQTRRVERLFLYGMRGKP